MHNDACVTVPPADLRISRDVVAELIAEHAAFLSEERVGARFEGWDNVTFRIGTSHTIRLPRLNASVPLIEVEQRWVPKLRLPVSVPELVVAGSPSETFPAPWSILTWVPGTVLSESPLNVEGAADLGRALASLHGPAPLDAPVCEWRATSLADRRADHIAHVDAVGADIDTGAAVAMYDDAAAAQLPSRVWVHADIHTHNLLAIDGRLSGIIDWGEMSAGDPLQDLGQAFVLVGAELFASVLEGYGHDLDERQRLVLRGHAVDTAARLAATALPGHRESARRALREIGVAAA